MTGLSCEVMNFYHLLTEYNTFSSVTTVRFADQHNLKLSDAGPSHTEFYLHIDNSNGTVPFLTKEREAKFVMPMNILWHEGMSLATLGIIFIRIRGLKD